VNKRKFIISLLALGISSISTQLVIIREMMSTFGGNEIVMGVTLGLWLLFTGAGSKLGTVCAKISKTEKALFIGHILIAVLPFMQVAAIRAIPLFRLQGELLGLGSVLGASSLILLPYCIVSGGILPVAGCLLKEKDTPRKVYIADAIGDIAGGLLFSLVLVYLFSHWSTLIILGLINLLAGLIIASSSAAIPVVTILAVGLFCSLPIDTVTQSWHFPGQQLLTLKNTRYAQLGITKSEEQLNVLQDAVPLFSTENPETEALAHLSLSQIEKPDAVLLISGGIFGTIKELSKHHPSHIDYVELDPAILELAPMISHHGLNNPIVHTHIGDGRLFIKKTSKRYSAIILDLPDPENIHLNRFYTEEFFQETRKILKPGGVLCFTLSGSANYMSEQALLLNRSVYAALKKVFSKVLVFPGDTHYYLASDGPLRADIGQALFARGITTKRLTHYELPIMTDPLRLSQLKELLSQGTKMTNHDLSPFAFGHLLNLWTEKTGSRQILLIALFIVAIGSAILLSSRDVIRYVIISTGYAAMGMELFLILLFQIIYGYVYLGICAFVTLFMIGAPLGAFLSAKWKYPSQKQLFACDIVWIFLAISAYIAAHIGIHLKESASIILTEYVLIPLVLFIAAMAAGCQFVAAAGKSRGTGAEITGGLYLADFVGAGCGSLLIGLVILPWGGVQGVIISILALKALSLILLSKKARIS
jgi:spermidine synthase